MCVGLQTSAGPSPIIRVGTWGKDLHLLPDWTPGVFFPRVGRRLGLEEAWTYLSSSARSSFPSTGSPCSVGLRAGARNRFSWCAENTPGPPAWRTRPCPLRSPGSNLKVSDSGSVWMQWCMQRSLPARPAPSHRSYPHPHCCVHPLVSTPSVYLYPANSFPWPPPGERCTFPGKRLEEPGQGRHAQCTLVPGEVGAGSR